MYSDRTILEQQGHLLFRKDQPGHSGEENPASPGENQAVPHNPYAQAYPLGQGPCVPHAATETINTSHIKNLFQHNDANLAEHAAQILGGIVYCPQNELLRFLMNALYCRCEWVYTHSVNVALISLIIAEGLDLDKQQMEILAVGSLLHDVGKLNVPQAILEKDSSLSDTEMALMKKHCEFGTELVAIYGLPQEIMDVMIQHHERLDGSGYPHGLTSAEIHPLAKITMIADVLDAITSYRPYRPARSIEEAISLIKLEGDKFSREHVAVIEKLHG